MARTKPMAVADIENLEYLYRDHPLWGVVQERDKEIGRLRKSLREWAERNKNLEKQVARLQELLKGEDNGDSRRSNDGVFVSAGRWRVAGEQDDDTADAVRVRG